MKTEAEAETKSILHKEFHARLLSDLEHYAGVAGIPQHMIHEPMAKYCSPEECDWIKNIKLHREKGMAGLCLTGINKEYPVERRMMAMAAALLRNYVDARVLTMHSLLGEYENGEVESPTVLLIPNFYVEYSGGKTNTNWQVQILQDLLMSRMVAGKITIIYVQSLEGLRERFGESLGTFIEAQWTVL